MSGAVEKAKITLKTSDYSCVHRGLAHDFDSDDAQFNFQTTGIKIVCLSPKADE
jgi:hypothetical protein